MGEQLLISVSREFGSGGREIARMIARDLGMTFYDRNLLDQVAEERGMESATIKKYDEKPRNLLLSRRIGEHSNSLEEHIAQMQFEYIKNEAESGKSFVILGRCAETVLKSYPGLVSIFILGDRGDKIAATKEKFQLSEQAAVTKMNRHDRSRKGYHNRHSDFRWGDSRGYDICINSSRLGREGTAKALEAYIERRRALLQQ